MNKVFLSIAIAAAFLLLPLVTFAHDAKLHKGKPVHGTITFVTPDGFDLKTAKGVTHVSYDKIVNFEKGDEDATREDIRVGLLADVIGTTLESGEIVAHEVILEPHVHQ